MRGLGLGMKMIGRPQRGIGRPGDVARGGKGDRRVGRIRQPFSRLRRRPELHPHPCGGNRRDPDGLVGTGLDAGGRLTFSQTAVAKIAFPDDAPPRRIARDFVRTFHHAITAADALIVEMPDDSGRGILFIREHRATEEAGRFDAMMTGGGDGALNREHLVAGRRTGRARDRDLAEQHPDIPPALVVVESVQRMTCRDAALASGTPVEVDLEGVLLARARCGEGNQIAIVPFKQRNFRVMAS